jgi:O-antigen ligase
VLLGEESGVRFQLLITVTFILSVLLRPAKRLAHIRHDGAPLLLLWGFTALATASAGWAEVSSSQALDAVVELIKTLVMVSVLVPVINSESRLLMVMVGCVMGVWHAAFAHTFGVRLGYVPGAFAGSIGVLPDSQTAVLILFIPLLLVMAVFGRRWLKCLALVVVPFVLNSIVSSYQRTGLVSLAVEGVLLVLFLPKRLTLRWAPVLVIIVVVFFVPLAPEDYWTRAETILSPHEEASANSRFVIAGASLAMLSDYPFGVGYRNYPDVSPRYLGAESLSEGRRSAHNSFFAVACETGIPGFALWMAAIVSALLMLRRVRKGMDHRAPTFVAVTALALETGLYGWLVGGLFQDYHEVDPAYWFVVFAIVLTRLNATGVSSLESEAARQQEKMKVTSNSWPAARASA